MTARASARAGRAVAVVLALAAATLSASPRASAQRTNKDAYERVARLLSEWRYHEAGAILRRLERSERHHPSVELRYLEGEDAFLHGHYKRSLSLLKGIEDDGSGVVSDLRKLVASTYATTRGYAHARSAGGHFIIYYPPGKDELIVDLAGRTLETARKILAHDFGWVPPEPVRVEILTAPSDLARVSTLTEKEINTTGTIALCKYGKLMLVTPRATIFGYPWMDTIVHEYVHYIVSRLSHDTVPVWLQEGLARYQQTRWRSPPALRLSAPDKRLLADALRHHHLITFDAMYPSMAKLPSQKAAALAFDEVYSMVSYLHDTVGYAGIRSIIALERKGQRARAAVAAVVGKPWKKVQRGWKRYLAAAGLERGAARTAHVRARRIRFKKGKGSTDNVGLDEIRNTKARKYTRLGGLLRARGMLAAAAREYEKALALTGPGDPVVAAKLSRTYLDLQKYQKAIALAKPLARADDTDAAPATTLGVAYLATGDVADARTAFETALRVSPFDPTVRCGLAKVYAKTGDTELARRERTACSRLQ